MSVARFTVAAMTAIDRTSAPVVRVRGLTRTFATRTGPVEAVTLRAAVAGTMVAEVVGVIPVEVVEATPAADIVDIARLTLAS